MTSEQAMEQCKDRMLISPSRAQVLWAMCKSKAQVGRMMIEVGAYKGGSARLMGLAAPEMELHVFDTFAGIAGADGIGHHGEYDFPAPAGEVAAYLSDLDNSFIHGGVFPGTWRQWLFDSGAEPIIAVAHCDCDAFRPTWDFIREFLPIVGAGGAMVFDDYLSPACPGVTLAVNDWFPTWRVEKQDDWQAVLRF